MACTLSSGINTQCGSEDKRITKIKELGFSFSSEYNSKDKSYENKIFYKDKLVFIKNSPLEPLYIDDVYNFCLQYLRDEKLNDLLL